MSETPEGKVKRKIKELLRLYSSCYYHCPVINGMGAPTLDFVGCSGGEYFAIEAKKKGGRLTERQKLTIEQMKHAGGSVFVIDSEDCADFQKLTVMLARNENRALSHH